MNGPYETDPKRLDALKDALRPRGRVPKHPYDLSRTETRGQRPTHPYDLSRTETKETDDGA